MQRLRLQLCPLWLPLKPGDTPLASLHPSFAQSHQARTEHSSVLSSYVEVCRYCLLADRPHEAPQRNMLLEMRKSPRGLKAVKLRTPVGPTKTEGARL